MNAHISIIGGGLSGLCCAIHLKLLGHDVQVFEKSSYPRHKVCGEYLSLEVLPYLNQLGLELTNYELPIIDRLQVSGINGIKLKSKLPLGAIGISRYLLEELLYRRALELHIPILTNCKIDNIKKVDNQFELTHKTQTFKTNISIIAAGRKSIFDRLLNRKAFEIKSPFVGIKYHLSSNLEIPSNLISLHNFRGGYAGISQIEDGKFNFCYLVHQNKLKASNSIRELEEVVLKENPELKSILDNSTSLFKTPLTVQNVSFSAKSSVENGIYFLGDSAGSIAPLCGNGMAMAIHSAKLLADALHKKDLYTENSYQEKWRKSFKTRLKIGQHFQKLLGQNTVTNLSLRAIKILPQRVFENIISLTHGNEFRSEFLDIQQHTSYEKVDSNTY
ncbi:NAD(P)/FAD-dependent oxidoreductase [Sediminitomix flava]|uniref:Flavin-dependent dehydrogenase n=1 Tax=Sediminitomix flava TaxID=379075 RepID=A0A315Z731_SEDFL|nr:NAD(P)/FAD-dependent oxidoreductase [Sediminitomix flava]PWJ40133.1 flavin-dependent dehydrogenase [Sediminitomix flava]